MRFKSHCVNLKHHWKRERHQSTKSVKPGERANPGKTELTPAKFYWGPPPAVPARGCCMWFWHMILETRVERQAADLINLVGMTDQELACI